MSVRAWVRAPTQRGQLRATITHRNAGHHHTPEPADGTPKPFTSGGDMTFARVISFSPLTPPLRSDIKEAICGLRRHILIPVVVIYLSYACSLLDDNAIWTLIRCECTPSG